MNVLRAQAIAPASMVGIGPSSVVGILNAGHRERGREYVLAGPKALFWPALLVYKVLRHLSA